MNLSDKITSYEDYIHANLPNSRETIGGMYRLSGDVLALDGGMLNWTNPVSSGHTGWSNVDRLPRNAWWAHREHMRMKYRVYPAPTAVITMLNAHPVYQQYFVHISSEDPNMISFTASIDDGRNDRQTRMALGRFLRKYCLMIDDPTIAGLEAQHRGELNPAVEFIIAEKDPRAFLDAYQSISSCMSKSAGAFVTPEHPVLAYCTPGFQLAVLKNGAGNNSARSLVWINPADENDKRMVRTYGDVVLDNWLKKNGFKSESFEGAWLKTAEVPRATTGRPSIDHKAISCPYVDYGHDRKESEQNVYGVWDGADRIYLMKRQSKLKVPESYRISTATSSGLAFARPFPVARKCAISGEEINAFKDDFVEVMAGENMEIAFGLTKHAKDWVRVLNAGKYYFVHPNTKLFSRSGYTYADTPVTRRAAGFMKLDDKLYPNEQNWFHKDEFAWKAVMRDGVMTVVKAEDVFILIDHAHRSYVYKDDLPKDAVRCASIDEHKTWCTASTTTVTTEANRRVVPGVHDVKQAIDGKWYYSRSLKPVMILNQKMWIPQDMDPAAIKIEELPPQIITTVTDAVRSVNQLANAKKKALFNTFSRHGDMLCPRNELPNNGGVQAAYIFEYRDITIGLIEPWLRGDIDSMKITDMPKDRVVTLHKYGKLVLQLVDKLWEESHPKAAAKVAETQAA